jgi:nitrate reductase NapA
MWTQTTNPWVSIPNLNRIQREPGDGRFLVVSDIYPTPSTEVADLVLPSAAWVEREGVFGNSERRTQQWHKAVDPPGEATEDAWQIVQVAKRMGMEHLFPWPDDNWHEPMYEETAASPSVSGRTWPPTSSSRRRAACCGPWWTG